MMFLYMIAMLAACGVSWWAYLSRPRKYADLMGVSVLLLVVFVVNNVIVTLFDFPDAILASPVLDLALAVMIFRSWEANRDPWKVVLVAALVAQLMLHLSAVALWRTDALTQSGLHLYVVSVNAFFTLQLLTLGSVGAGHGLDCLRRWVSDRGRHSLVPYGRR